MSHIEDFLVNANTPNLPHKRGDITSAWDCYTAGGRSAKLYRTGGKTPRRRFSYYAADLPAATDEGQYSEVLEELVDAQWQVFRVSPLWNVTWEAAEKRGQDLETSGATASTNILRMLDLNVERQYDERGLRRYARVITGYVATHAVSGQDNPYSVEMETLKGLKGTRTDSDAIKISVYTSMMGEVKKIFLGILCGIEAAELQLKSNDVVNLPVLLTQGNKDTKERVIFGLEKCFDCVISPLYLPDEELRWMSAMWAGETEETCREESGPQEEENTKSSKGSQNKSKKSLKTTTVKKHPEELKLTFVLPRRDEETDKAKIRHFTCAFPTDQIHQVWKHVHSSSDMEFSDNEMEKFHDILRNVIYDNTKIDTDGLELYQITLPFLKAVRSGIIRIDKTNHVKVVLRYLTELCQGNMFQADPTLAASVQDNCTMEWA